MDQKAYDRIKKEAAKILCLTVGICCDKFKINGAVARKVLRALLAEGIVKRVGDAHHAFNVYTGKEAKGPTAAAATAK